MNILLLLQTFASTAALTMIAIVALFPEIFMSLASLS